MSVQRDSSLEDKPFLEHSPTNSLIKPPFLVASWVFPTAWEKSLEKFDDPIIRGVQRLAHTESVCASGLRWFCKIYTSDC
jgi:hypothetical protein